MLKIFHIKVDHNSRVDKYSTKKIAKLRKVNLTGIGIISRFETAFNK